VEQAWNIKAANTSSKIERTLNMWNLLVIEYLEHIGHTKREVSDFSEE